MLKKKIENQVKNFGLIVEPPRFTDYFLGAGTKIPEEVLCADRNWLVWKPVFEKQHSIYFDSMACVTFSALNVIEFLHKRLWDFEINLSDRFLAKMSGTCKNGNTLVNVADTLRKIGDVDEERWDYPTERRIPVFDWDDFYCDIPKWIQDEALKLLKDYEIKYEWVISTPENYYNALQYAPLQTTVNAWYKKSDGTYYNPNDSVNHAVALVSTRNIVMDSKGKIISGQFGIYDTYAEQGEDNIKWVDYDYKFGSHAMKYFISKKNIMLDALLQVFKKKNNGKLIRNNQTGSYAWFYNDSLRIPSDAERTALLAISYLHKNNGGATISNEEWEKLPKVEF